MKQRTLILEPYARIPLEQMRDHHPVAYLRERAAGLLKIADGMSVHQVAQAGLLKPRKADTVYGWLNAYLASGIGGLYQAPRRGSSFPPPLEPPAIRDHPPGSHKLRTDG